MPTHPYRKDEVAISRARKALFVGSVAVIATSVGIGALTVAQAAPQTAATTAAATTMPSAVEDFAYPNAAKILQDRQITLKRGDGHIMLTDCAQPWDLQVRSRLGHFCFAVNGKKGLLTLELPDSFGIDTTEHPVSATLDVGGKESVVNAPANDFTPMGESGSTGERSILVELRVSS